MVDDVNNANKATPRAHTGKAEGAEPPSNPQVGREGRKRREGRSVVRLSDTERAALDAWMAATGKTFADFVRLHLTKSSRSAAASTAAIALLARIEVHLAEIADKAHPWPPESFDLLERMLVIERLCRRAALGEDTR